MNEQAILETIKDMLTDIIGEEFIEEYSIELKATLTGDLEMESIEIVELSEKIKKHYGEKVEFNQYMAKLSLDEIVNLSIKDVVNYIDECQELN